MAIPPFWATPFSYTELLAVTDVNTIIAGINTAVLAMGWTDTSGVGTGPWVTLARADGIKFKVQATRISATRLAWIIYDHCGLNMMVSYTDSRQDIEATGCPVQIYVGSFHFVVNAARAVHETFFAFVCDQTPDPLGSPRPFYMATYGPRTTDGTLRNYSWDYLFYLNPLTGTAYQQTNGRCIVPYMQQQSPVRLITAAGTKLIGPPEFGDSTNQNWWGRWPQAVMVDGNSLVPGSEITVPIDAGVTGVFKVIGAAQFNNIAVAVRKA